LENPVKNTLRLLPGTFLLLGCAVACSSQTTTTHPAAAPSSPAGAAAPASTGPGSDPSSDVPLSGGAGTGSQPADQGSPPDNAAAGDDSSAFCTEARTLDSEGRLELTAADDQSVQELDKMDGLAPQEIAADMHSFDKLAHQVVSDNPDPAAIAAITSPDELARIQRIKDYLGQHCGIASEQD
jgi:hypothetical protein